MANAERTGIEEMLRQFADAYTEYKNAEDSLAFHQEQYVKTSYEYLRSDPYEANHALMEYQRAARDAALAKRIEKRNEYVDASNNLLAEIVYLTEKQCAGSDSLGRIRSYALKISKRRSSMGIATVLIFSSLFSIVWSLVASQFHNAVALSLVFLVLLFFMSSMKRSLDDLLELLSNEAVRYVREESRRGPTHIANNVQQAERVNRGNDYIDFVEGKIFSLTNRGEYEEAENELNRCLDRLPPTEKCSGRIAGQRLQYAVLLADILKRQDKDVERQLHLLNESVLLLEKAPLPPPLPGPDRKTNLEYMVFVNRAIAAGKLNKLILEEESWSRAYQKAKDTETRCKCLTFQIWSILKQRDEAKIDSVKSLIGEYDGICKKANERDIPLILRYDLEIARVVHCLYCDDIRRARTSFDDALRMGISAPGIKQLQEILTDQVIDSRKAMNEIIELWKNEKEKSECRKTLSPLSEGILKKDEIESLSKIIRPDSMIGSVQYGEFENVAQALSDTGEHEEIEGLVREKLSQHTSLDEIRCNLLITLGRSLKNQSRFEEALSISAEAIFIAHHVGEINELILALDLRAEILCFKVECYEALHVLVEADRYLNEEQIENPNFEAWMAHTYGMAYSGCGCWKEARENLLKAMNTMQYLRLWSEFALACGDYANMILWQFNAEGADIDHINEALHYLEIARQQFESFNDKSNTLHTTLHELMLRAILAELQRDVRALLQLRYELEEIGAKNHGKDRFFAQPAHFTHLMLWTSAMFRVARACIDLNVFPERNNEILEAQLRYMNNAVGRAPDMLDLWLEKALTHLYRGRYEIDVPSIVVQDSMNCLESIFKNLVIEKTKYGDSKIRSQWLMSHNNVLDMLGEIALFAFAHNALSDIQILERIIALAQNFRGGSRKDFIVSSGETKEISKDNEIRSCVERIRNLNSWLLRFNAPISQIQEIYPEYNIFYDREQIERELTNLKARLLDRVSKPSYLALIPAHADETPFRFSDIRDSLMDGDVVLDYYLGSSKLHVALIGKEQLHVLRLPIENIRELYETTNDLLPESERSFVGNMNKCSKWFFPSELVSLLKNAKRLYIVASGPLWRIPFAWLNADGQVAMTRWEICIVPSAQFAGRSRKLISFKNTYVIGHPGQPRKANYLPEVKNEVDDLKTEFGIPKEQVLLSEGAKPEQIICKVFPNADLIHFTCHGSCDSVAPLMSSLQLEPDDTHRDGFLYLYEIKSSVLHATLVSFFACSTAQSKGQISFQESLAHTVLGLGANYVVATLWEADPNESSMFAKDFYRLLKEKTDPVEAFHTAQQNQLKRSNICEDGKTYLMIKNEDIVKTSNFVLLTAR
jgi:CHAT domain-containing protein